jgi:DNA-binding CsgD family transcriptional regulator
VARRQLSTSFYQKFGKTCGNKTIMRKPRTHDQGITRLFGYLSASCMLALASESWPDIPSRIYVGFGALFALITFVDSRHPLQAFLYLAFAAHQGIVEAVSPLSLVAVLIAVSTVLTYGWFVRNTLVKAIVVGIISSLTLSCPLLVWDGSVSAIIQTAIYIGVTLFFILGLAHGRFLSAFVPKKRVLRLADFCLTEREQSFAIMRAEGKSVKEIAIEHNLSIASVRSGLSSLYRKLDVHGSLELIALGGQYQLK